MINLSVEKVRKSYGARRVLRDVTLAGQGGEVVAVTGPNGSGKSTLLKIVAGLVRPTQGAVKLTTSAGDQSEPGLRRRSVGYAAPDVVLYPELSARENLEFFARVRGLRVTTTQINERLVQVGLGGRGEDFVGAYSSGMRQRMRLLLALLHDPDVLLLDEPGLALDEAGVTLVSDIVAQQTARGGLTLMATNDAREAQMGTRTVALGI